MLVLRLALRALRWRAAAAASVFAVALVAVLAATVGPIYLHAVNERVLAVHLHDAGDARSDVMVSRTSVVGYGNVAWARQVSDIADQLARSPYFGEPRTTVSLPISYGRGLPPALGSLATLPQQCAHVHVVSGHCVDGTGTSTRAVMLSTKTAARVHLGVGDALPVVSQTTGAVIALRIAGIYRPVAERGAFWAPWDYFRAGEVPQDDDPPPTDAAFVTSAGMAAQLGTAAEMFEANVPFQRAKVGYNDLGPLRATLARANATSLRLGAAASSTGVPAAAVATDLSSVLRATQSETRLARTLVTVATVQLALLAILVLYSVVSNTASAQGPEVALAKLRGRRIGSVLVQSIAQPFVLVVLAAPVAAVLAWVLMRLLVPHLIGPGIAVTFSTSAYLVAAIATAGGVLAAVVAARRIVVTPVGALLRRGGEAPAARTGLLVADAAALTIAVAGLIELRVGGVLDGGSPNPLAVLAPTLLAIALAVVVLRLMPFVGRRVAGWTRDSPRVATFLAVRQLLRRPAEARALLLVAVALAIAAFAVTNWTDARHNREVRALNTTGADTVLVVQPPNGVVDLRPAVDRADPGGQAMAVEYSEADGLPPLLAVDTSRFARVAAWTRANTGPDLTSVLHRLSSARRPEVAVRGSRLRLTIDLLDHPARQRIELAVSLSEPDREVAARLIMHVEGGRSTRTVTLPAVCAQGCRLTGLGFSGNASGNSFIPSSGNIMATVQGSQYDGSWQPLRGLPDAGLWRGDGKGQASLQTAGSALAISISQSTGGGTWPTIVPSAIPVALPAVVGSTTAAQYVGSQIHQLAVVGLDGQSVDADGQIRSVTLPRVDRNGIMVDLQTALTAMTDSTGTTTQFQVWLSPSAPGDVIARLEREHVRVVRVIRSATALSSLDDSGSAFADDLFLVAALAATVLAVGATAAGRVLSTRRRAYELAALEAVGVSARALRRATALEQSMVLVVGLLVGLVAGLVGSRLALPSTPVFADTNTGPPLVIGLPWALLGLLTAGLVVAFVLVSLAIARLVERAATPGQLRGAQQ